MFTSDDYSAVMSATSAVSIVADLYIIITFCVIENVRHKIYTKLVYFIALSDLFAALGTVIGMQTTNTPLCIFQSVTSTAFHLMAVFWTLMLTHLLYNIVVKGHPTKIKMLSVRTMGVYAIILIMSVLPLLTNQMGRIEEVMPGRCFVSNRPSELYSAHRHTELRFPYSSLFWVCMSYYVWIWIAIGWTTSSFVYISYRIRGLFGENERTQALKALVCRQFDKCWPFPIILVVCFMLPSIIDVLCTIGLYRTHSYTYSADGTKSIHTYNAHYIMAAIAGICPTLHGTLNSLIFYTCNKKMLNSEWMKVLSFTSWVCNGRKIAVTDAYAIVVDFFVPKRERVPEEEAHSMSDIMISAFEIEPQQQQQQNQRQRNNNNNNNMNAHHSTIVEGYGGPLSLSHTEYVEKPQSLAHNTHSMSTVNNNGGSSANVSAHASSSSYLRFPHFSMIGRRAAAAAAGAGAGGGGAGPGGGGDNGRRYLSHAQNVGRDNDVDDSSHTISRHPHYHAGHISNNNNTINNNSVHHHGTSVLGTRTQTHTQTQSQTQTQTRSHTRSHTKSASNTNNVLSTNNVFSSVAHSEFHANNNGSEEEDGKSMEEGLS